MRGIVKAFRRPPTGRMDDQNGGLPRLSDGVARASRCPASPRRTLLAENLGKPSLGVIIIEIWYRMVGDDWGQCQGGQLGSLRAHVEAGKLSAETLHAEM